MTWTSVLALVVSLGMQAIPPRQAFEIHVVDAATGRGVPLVELTTVDEVTYLTDSAGRIAYDEPARTHETVFFSVKSPGYEIDKDGFGFAGVRLVIEPGQKQVVPIRRINLAERLYRITGQDRYRDSVLLGYDIPDKSERRHGKVAGQDSVFAETYRGRIWWFWGDTLRLSYPLGHYRTAGAITPLALKPDEDIPLHYFVDADGFSRPMAELPDKDGVIWLDGFATVPTSNGEALLAHYSRRKSLEEAVEQGLMRFNDEREVFERITTLPLKDNWHFPRDHTNVVRDGETEYIVFGNPFPVTRVRRTVDDIISPTRYESWTCLDPEVDPATAPPRRDASGRLDYSWRHAAPVTQQVEQRWLKLGLIQPDKALYSPQDAASGKRVLLHSGTTRWNEHRKKWVMIAVEAADLTNSPSYLGEVWYSESASPQGPWTTSVRILTHPKQTFYNPCHHVFLDEDGGRVIYFEGTYCNTFTNSPASPRYNYNQMMYRLDLDHPTLKAAFER